jgi:hypothetical protein
MHRIATCFLILTSLFSRAQPPDSLLVFSGYILDEDSLPIRNVMMVNFRTLKYCVTNENGFFRMQVNAGDSLMANHISYDRRIINTNSNRSEQNKFSLAVTHYMIKMITVKFRDIEMENFRRNMDQIFVELKAYSPVYTKGTGYNKYAPPPKDQTFGLNIIDLYNWIKTQKHKQGEQKNHP